MHLFCTVPTLHQHDRAVVVYADFDSLNSCKCYLEVASGPNVASGQSVEEAWASTYDGGWRGE